MTAYTRLDFLLMRIHKEASGVYIASPASDKIVNGASADHDAAKSRSVEHCNRLWREAKLAGRGCINSNELDPYWDELRVASQGHRNAVIRWFMRSHTGRWEEFLTRLGSIGFTGDQIDQAVSEIRA
jgi:hypothetical protein